MEFSIIEYLGEQVSSHCGYCKTNEPDKFTHGMWAHDMTPLDYQDLIDRGWRRSGQYCYKPTLSKTCCPQYTIRQEALHTSLTRSQKNVCKRFNRFLATGERPKVRAKQASQPVNSDETESNKQPHKPLSKLRQPADDVIKGSTYDISIYERRPEKAKAKRIRKAQERWAAKNLDANDMNAKRLAKRTKSRSVEEWLQTPSLENSAHKLEVRLVCVNVSDGCGDATFCSTLTQSHSVYFAYQTRIHGDPPDKPTLAQYKRFLCNSPIEIRLIRTDNQRDLAFLSSVRESHVIYKKYQMAVHGDPPDDVDFQQFRNFLVDSPLKHKSTDVTDHPGYGAFHQHYILDGKIIAVGVIDILPRCVSSVYLYYDPDFDFLNLGTYTALQEMAFVRRLHALDPDLQYYYMGFYIHSCPKMYYKGNFRPSYLVCPEVYTWHPIEQCRPKLDAAKYARFNPDPQAEDKDGYVAKRSLNKVLLLHERKPVQWRMYAKQKLKSITEEKLKEYVSLVGHTTCERSLLMYAK